MKWFGQTWLASVCVADEQEPVPEGAACARCKSAILATHQGFFVPAFSRGEWVGDLIYHRMCFVGHLGGLN